MFNFDDMDVDVVYNDEFIMIGVGVVVVVVVVLVVVVVAIVDGVENDSFGTAAVVSLDLYS